MQVLQNIIDSTLYKIIKTSDNSDLIYEFVTEYVEKKESSTIESLEKFNNITNYDEILYLDLSTEGLTKIPENIMHCKNLKALNLSGNSFLGEDTNIISNLTNLGALFLSDCDLESLRIDFLQMPNLTILSLANNRIDELDLIFEQLENLLFLDISGHSLHNASLPLNINKLKNLLYLDASQTDMKILGENGISNLSYLKILDLSNNELETLPNDIERLNKLEVLHLKENNFGAFPSVVTKLTNLKHLCINGSFAELGENIGDLVELKELDLEKANLVRLPFSFRNLLELEKLALSHNAIEVFPTEIIYLTSLTVLRIDNNKLNGLPNEIENLQKLELISLEGNLFIEFPLSITKLPSIKKLNISGNNISILPPEISRLQKLEVLGLMFNELQQLPTEIGELKRLSDLFLDFNKLDEYPIELAKLKRLNRLYIIQNHSNPLSKMPEQVKEWSLIELFEYLDEKKGEHNHFVFWDIPKELRTPFQQYLAYFQDYVEKKYNKEIVFEVSKIQGGLKLTTKSTLNLKIQQIDTFLSEYVDIFLNQNLNHIHFTPPDESDNVALLKFNELIRELKTENHNLTMNIERFQDRMTFQKEIIHRQDKEIEELRLILRSFQTTNAKQLELLGSSFSPTNPNIIVNVIQDNVHETKMIGTNTELEERTENGFKPEKLLMDIVDKLTRMLERKKVEKLEDLHNNDLTHFLRDKKYYVTDQTQSGISHKNLGELDMMIRKTANGSPVSIIEAFRLKSCGEDDLIISSHIDKLLHDYDTAGHKVNFVIVYAEAKKFQSLWESYIAYMQSLNNKKGFRNEYPLISFIDTGKSAITDIKVGLAIHQRENMPIQVYHIFVNMSV